MDGRHGGGGGAWRWWQQEMTKDMPLRIPGRMHLLAIVACVIVNVGMRLHLLLLLRFCLWGKKSPEWREGRRGWRWWPLVLQSGV